MGAAALRLRPCSIPHRVWHCERSLPAPGSYGRYRRPVGSVSEGGCDVITSHILF